jgi:hypothetical protein
VSFSRRHVHLIVESKPRYALDLFLFFFSFFKNCLTARMTNLSNAIADEKTRFEDLLISMSLNEKEIGAALDAFERAELQMRSGPTDNERLKILHTMCQDIIAVIGGLHDSIGGGDDDDDDAGGGGGKQKAVHKQPAKPRDFLMDALEAWR